MIVVAGLSHRTAAIEVRERLALPRDVVPSVLTELLHTPEIAEALLLATCNRVELVVAPRPEVSLESTAQAAVAALELRATRGGGNTGGLASHLYVHQGLAAVRHLFRVAASLDSLVLGEPQILGQLKAALGVAREAGTAGPRLERVVARAVKSAKRVRTETTIGTGQVSVPSVAVDLARQIFDDLSGRVAVLIGSGAMAESAARILRGEGARLLVVGRNAHRVAELARVVGGEPRAWSDLRAALIEADVVITSTSAPTHVISRDFVAELRRPRRGRSLFFIDLAVPRDVEPAVERLEGVFSYNVDDLSRVVAESLASREQEAVAATALVEAELAAFQRWADAEHVTPVLVALRRSVRSVLEAEVERSLRGGLRGLGAEGRAALARMVEAATKKLCHFPTARLREVAADREGEGYRTELLAEALTELFALLPESESESEPESEPSPADATSASPLDAPHPADAVARGSST